jgi:uridine kinase
MANSVKITFKINEKEIAKKEIEIGTQVSSLLDNFNIDKNTIYAVLINNELCSLDSKIKYTSTLEPILNNTKEGSSVYRRSLCLLLAAAAHNIFPDTRLLVGHSLGHGYYYTLDNGKKIEAKQITSLGREMSALVKKDIPIITSEISWQEAAKLFEKLGLTETRKQLNYNCTPSIKINTLDTFSDLYFGPLVLSTGVLKTFELMKYGNGFLLRFPKSSEPDKLAAFKDQPKLFEIYSKYKE